MQIITLGLHNYSFKCCWYVFSKELYLSGITIDLENCTGLQRIVSYVWGIRSQLSLQGPCKDFDCFIPFWRKQGWLYSIQNAIQRTEHGIWRKKIYLDLSSFKVSFVETIMTFLFIILFPLVLCRIQNRSNRNMLKTWDGKK